MMEPSARILIVDDDPAVRLVVKTTLETRQYYTYLAEDGTTALELVNELSPDLIILDWILPDITGLEVCKVIRRTSDVPILMLTAVNDLDRRLASLEAGDDYLEKPFEPQELLARVKTLLRWQRRSNPPPRLSKEDQIRAALGLLFTILDETGNPELRNKASELRVALQQEEPDIDHLTSLRRYFTARPRKVREAAETFFNTPVIQRIIKEATKREFGES